MRKLIVKLTKDRAVEGTIHLEENGSLIAGPFPVCGRADMVAAKSHGNPSRNPLLPYGDTPSGHYRVIGTLPSGDGTARPKKYYGPNNVLVLAPTGGDAALADANGRFHILIQGGARGPDQRLLPTNGSLRLADKDLEKLVQVLGIGKIVECECEVRIRPVKGKPVATSVSYELGDPPMVDDLFLESRTANSGRGINHANGTSEKTHDLLKPATNRLLPVKGMLEDRYPAPDYDPPQQAVDGIDYLNQTANYPPPYGHGQCAAYVIDAINKYEMEDDQIHVNATGYYGSKKGYAEDLGLALTDPNNPSAGFKEVYDSQTGGSYQPQKGDIAVIQHYPGQDPAAGHACMWNGNEWVSDYHQGVGRTSPYPWRDGTYDPAKTPYKIYRWPQKKAGK
jgi:hypothetical protein